jgi:hypothetical protein
MAPQGRSVTQQESDDIEPPVDHRPAVLSQMPGVSKRLELLRQLSLVLDAVAANICWLGITI